jgi:hypothetical protein
VSLLDLQESSGPGRGVGSFDERRNGDRRRASIEQDRRRSPRAGPDRRRADRRGAARIARAGLLAILALAFPKPDDPRDRDLVEVLTTDFRVGDQRRFIDQIIADAASKYRVRPDLVRAVIQVESGFNPWAVSRVGAAGLMQLMPETARELGVDNPFDPEQNVFGGARYLSTLIERFNGNVALAVAGYNAGPNAVSRYRDKIPPYAETRGYVKKVQAAQYDWLRESGEESLEPFELRAAHFWVAPKPKRARLRFARKGKARMAVVRKAPGRMAQMRKAHFRKASISKRARGGQAARARRA